MDEEIGDKAEEGDDGCIMGDGETIID